MLKKTLINVLLGIGMGSTLLTLSLFISNLLGAEHFFNYMIDDFTRQTLAFLAVSIVFHVLNFVYDSEKLSMFMKVSIHMGGGLLFYFILSPFVGWLPLQAGIGPVILTVFGVIIGSFGLWLIYALYYRHEARKINEKLSHLNK